ncbi:hypothetical protein GNF86_14905 [Clostridium perfringens]|jgi:hypothetical protein
MKKLNSRLLILSFVFLLSFNIVTDFKRQEVKASALAGTIGGITLGGLGDAAAGAIVLGGPYVAAFAVVCIGAGIVYKNREEIGAGLTNAYNYAQSLGKNLVDFFETDANGNVTVKAEGVDLIRGSVKNYMADPSTINGHLGDFDIAKEISSTKPSITNINFPVSESDTLVLNIKSNFQSSGEIDFLINGTSAVYLGNIFNITSYPNGIYLYLSYDSTGYKVASSLTSYDALMTSVKNNTMVKSFNSICADLSINVKNRRSYTGSISVDRLLGDSIGNSTGVDSDVTFRNPTLELDKDISVSIPTDLTWDKVIDKTYDKTLDATTESTAEGTGEGTGLWDWLKSLLNSILDAIKSILSSISSFFDWLKSLLISILEAIKAIPGAILSFFTIDWDLVNEHVVYDEIFKNKFKPFYDVAYLLQNINSNPSTHSGKFYMVIPPEMGGDGQEHCVLDLTVANNIISIARTFINAFIWIGFLWYILKLFSPKLNIG